jgi:hypothetical protein
MPPPLICLDDEVRHSAERFRSAFSHPHAPSIVTVLLRLLQCEGTRSRDGEHGGESSSRSGVRRMFSEAPWAQRTVVVRLSASRGSRRRLPNENRSA